MATQTGSIDLTASNGVKLMAEAGFTNAERTYATKSALGVQADRISMVVENSDASGNLTLTADALEYIGDHVEIKGTDGTSTVISGGQIQTGSLSIGALDSDAQSATLNSNISVGGRNLLYDTSDWSKWAKTAKATESNGVLTCANTDTSAFQRANGWFVLDKTDLLDREITVSFDAMKTDSTALSTLCFQVFTTSAAPKSVTSGNIEEGTRFFTNLSAASSSNAVIENADNINSSAWTRVSIRFVPSRVLVGNYTDMAYLAIYVGIRNQVGSAQFRRIKAEFGNTATDWTPAPEDVDSAIEAVPQYKVRTTTYSYSLSSWLTYAAEGAQDSWSQVSDVKVGDTVLLKGTNRDTGDAVYLLMTVDELRASGRVNKATSHGLVDPTAGQRADNAAKTATSYVTEITGQNGIMVHPSGDQTTGVQITSDVDIMRDRNSVLNVGTRGDTTSTDAGVTIYDGTASKNVVASFDSDEVSLGANSNSSTIDMCGGAFKFSIDASDPDNVTGLIKVDQNAIDDHTANTPSIRLVAGTSTSGRGIEIRGTSGAQYPVSIGEYYGSGISQNVSLGPLGVKTPGIFFDGEGTFEAYSGLYVKSLTGTNFWSTVPGTVLWSGTYYMTASHTANLAYNVSTCPTGVVLHFQPYTSGTAQNYFHQYCFVPKTTVTASAGAVHNFMLCNSGFANVGMKALRIYDNRIVGIDTNDDTGTASGITYNNAYWVLTQVIAV